MNHLGSILPCTVYPFWKWISRQFLQIFPIICLLTILGSAPLATLGEPSCDSPQPPLGKLCLKQACYVWCERYEGGSSAFLGA